MTSSPSEPGVLSERPPGDPDGTWIRRFHTAARPCVRLVCFPHAGASASAYFAMSAALAGAEPEIDVVAVQYPGRQDRRHEPLIEDISELADRVHHAIGGWTGLPVALFGHSMGATVAFEVARRLEAEGTRIRELFVSGRRAPSRVRPEKVRVQDDASVIAEVERLSGDDARVLRDPEMAAFLLPVLRADYRAIDRYRSTATEPLACPVSVLTGDADPLTTVDEAAAWKDHSTEPVTLDVFPGGHFFLNAHLNRVAALVRDRLAGPDGGPGACGTMSA